MLRTLAITAALLWASMGATEFTRRAKWRITDTPPLPLRSALALAEAELKLESTRYFCVSASLAKTFTNGDWVLGFSSKNGERVWLSVGSDRSIRKSTSGFEY